MDCSVERRLSRCHGGLEADTIVAGSEGKEQTGQQCAPGRKEQRVLES
jgi:hypothetical protein